MKLGFLRLRQPWRRLSLRERTSRRKEAEIPAPAEFPWAQAVESARREWLACRAYFDCVSDPELVDHAIYAVQAAERKYMYLLRKARLASVTLDRPEGPEEVESWQGLWEDPPPVKETAREH